VLSLGLAGRSTSSKERKGETGRRITDTKQEEKFFGNGRKKVARRSLFDPRPPEGVGTKGKGGGPIKGSFSKTGQKGGSSAIGLNA